MEKPSEETTPAVAGSPAEATERKAKVVQNDPLEEYYNVMQKFVKLGPKTDHVVNDYLQREALGSWKNEQLSLDAFAPSTELAGRVKRSFETMKALTRERRLRHENYTVAKRLKLSDEVHDLLEVIPKKEPSREAMAKLHELYPQQFAWFARSVGLKQPAPVVAPVAHAQPVVRQAVQTHGILPGPGMVPTQLQMNQRAGHLLQMADPRTGQLMAAHSGQQIGHANHAVAMVKNVLPSGHPQQQQPGMPIARQPVQQVQQVQQLASQHLEGKSLADMFG